jgi:hypothetical protein
MRLKQILRSTLIFTILSLFYWVVLPTPTSADECGGDCSVVVCGTTQQCQADGTCQNVPTSCTACGGNGCGQADCPPGQYQAPDLTCHDVDQGGCECGVKADGLCKSCGGGCNADYIVNCPSGGTKTTEVINTQCISSVPACEDANGDVVVGSAQSLGDCCSEKDTPNPPFEDERFCAIPRRSGRASGLKPYLSSWKSAQADSLRQPRRGFHALSRRL